jgi:hypothetical protein
VASGRVARGPLTAGLAAFALAASCAPVRVPEVRREVALTLHGDTRLSQEERWIVEHACAEWRRFTRGRVRIAVTWDLDEDAVIRSLWLPRLVRAEPWQAGTSMAQAHAQTMDPVAGYTVAGPPVVVHLVMRNAPELYPVVLHELGHVAGLEHVDAVRAVMLPGGGGWTFTAADEAECERVGVCTE